MSTRPHILITVADDHRYDALSGLSGAGESYYHTAHLDRLMERGTCYRQAYIPGSPHGAVCAPSRAMLHTGRTYFNTTDALTTMGEDAQPLPTLGSRLREAGYRTVGVGKWHNQEASFVRSFEFGHRVLLGGMSTHYCYGNVDFVPDTRGEKTPGRMEGHSVDLINNSAIEALKRYTDDGDDRPLLLYVAYTAPHDPRETYWRYHKQYPVDEAPVPKSFMTEHPFDNGALWLRDEELAESPRTPGEIRMHTADYAAILHHMDDGIGRLHAAAERAGLTAENTIVVHTADHGIAIGRHGLMGKQSVYDHSMRPPLIVAGPGFERGVHDDRLCYMQDLHPTLLEAAGVDAGDDCVYEHLRSATRREQVGSAYGEHMRQVRDERFKLIRTRAAGAEHTQLFDLQADPHELKNLADDAGHSETIRGLGDRMRAWQQWSGDDASGFA